MLPSIVITIGPLLLYLDHLVNIPRYPRTVGWALIAGPVILVATMTGTALAVTTGHRRPALVLLGTGSPPGSTILAPSLRRPTLTGPESFRPPRKGLRWIMPPG